MTTTSTTPPADATAPAAIVASRTGKRKGGLLGAMRGRLPLTIGLFVVAAAQWAWYRWGRERVGKRSAPMARVVTIVIGAIFIICVLSFRRGLVGELVARSRFFRTLSQSS